MHKGNLATLSLVTILALSACDRIGSANTTAAATTNANNTTTATAVNKAPVLENADTIVVGVTEGTQIALDLSSYENRFSDPEGDALTYKVVTDDQSLYMIDSNGKITFSAPQVDATTEYTGTITAVDPQGLESDALNVVFRSVDRADDAPLIFSTLTLENDKITTDGTLQGTTDINDSDGLTSVTFNVDGNSILNTGDHNSFNLDMSGLILGVGDYNLSVTASGKVKIDSENVNSGPITKTIGFTVTEAPAFNTAPTANNDSTSTAHNTSILVNVLANDTDAESTVSLTGVITNEVGGTFAVESGKIRFTPTDGFAGTASATYEIEDTEGLTATATLTVQVAEAPVVNTAPTANAGPDKTITEGDSVTFYGNGTDSDGTISSYIWRNSATGEVVGRSKNLTRNGLSVGTHTYSLQTKDNDGAYSKKDYVKVTVEALPPQEVSITTSGPVVSGADTDDILAENGPEAPVTVSLGINSPYTLSSDSLTFNPDTDGVIETQTVNILHDGKVIGNKSISVTWM